ncbi:MAG: hypothetical protein JOY54_05470 [Acidobacteriaceae bacterium]|nr:hypothetical protein [Acidobacteriaceae bacterium]
MPYCRSAAFIGFLLASTAWAQAGPGNEVWDRLLQDAYADHVKHLRDVLPEHSALPPTADLSKPQTDPREAGRLWEDRFTGSMGVREHIDPGLRVPSEATSISLTTTEYATPGWALPVHECDAILVGVPTAGSVHISYNQRFVYSTFFVRVEKVLKAKNKNEFREGNQIITAELGGTVRYPSGHEATFILAGRGFIETGKQYFLFVWKPIRSDKTYMTAEAYVIEEGKVFPVNLDFNESWYEKGVSLPDFRAKLKAALEEDTNAN